MNMANYSIKSHHLRAMAWALLAWQVEPVCAQESDDQPGFVLSGGYTGDLRRNTTGGIAVGTAYSHELDLGLTWNTFAFGNRVSSNFAVMYIGGAGITADYVGDLQAINNIEAPPGWRLYESWVEMSFGDHPGTLRAGVLDLNAEFDTPETGGVFVGSPFAVGTDLSQTGVRGPGIWPTTGLGIRAAGALAERVHWRLGVYDAAPGTDDVTFTDFHVSRRDGALLIGELAYASERIHKASIGSWGYTAPFERIDAELLADPGSEHGNHGLYATFDLALGQLGGMSFDGAMRAGTAPVEFNIVDRYVGVAFTASHLFESRPKDTLGLGVAFAHVGKSYRDVSEFDGTPATSAETLVELVYRTELAPWLALVPNVQFVNSPGAVRGVDDSWIAGLRFEMTAEHSWVRAPYARRQP
jgi:porin